MRDTISTKSSASEFHPLSCLFLVMSSQFSFSFVFFIPLFLFIFSVSFHILLPVLLASSSPRFPPPPLPSFNPPLPPVPRCPRSHLRFSCTHSGSCFAYAVHLTQTDQLGASLSCSRACTPQINPHKTNYNETESARAARMWQHFLPRWQLRRELISPE